MFSKVLGAYTELNLTLFSGLSSSSVACILSFYLRFYFLNHLSYLSHKMHNCVSVYYQGSRDGP